MNVLLIAKTVLALARCARMYRHGSEDLQNALDDTLMALHRERAEKSALEKEVTELKGIVAFQERQAERKASSFIAKCADYDA